MRLESKKQTTCNISLHFNFFYRIYENGVDIDIAKLYPPVEFPVSRGTPMISPLIEWDHSENHFVMSFLEGIPKSEKHFHIDLNDIDYKFIEGHLIDGKNSSSN